MTPHPPSVGPFVVGGGFGGNAGMFPRKAMKAAVSVTPAHNERALDFQVCGLGIEYTTQRGLYGYGKAALRQSRVV